MASCEEDLPFYIGMSIRSMNDQQGMEVVLVNSDSPGWHSGLKAGDILLEIDGQIVNNIKQYREIVESLDKDQKVSFDFKVMRKDRVKVI